jgi:hypothetical protein
LGRVKEGEAQITHRLNWQQMKYSEVSGMRFEKAMMWFIAGLLVVMTPRWVHAADKEYIYHQQSGKLTLDGKEVGSGYSGHGDGKNKPDKEAVKNVGPIPRGLYKIGNAREYKKMPNCFDLTPEGHDAHGRTEFLIHGDSNTAPGTASNGCIILGPALRKQIADSGIKWLRVERWS